MKNENVIKEVSKSINYKGKDYKIVFNLNVMEQIQDEYKTLTNWGALTDGSEGEVNIKALIFGFTAMLNEGIEIDNEENETDIKPLTKKQVGRMITAIGLDEMTNKLNETVTESTRSEEKNV